MSVRRAFGAVLVAWLGVGCAAGPRVVPMPAGGVALDPARGSATVEAEGVQVVVRPSAWHGSPSYLPGYVTPFHLFLVNGSRLPLHYDYPDLRLFDETRFQYTALPPVEVGRILRLSHVEDRVMVAAAATTTIPHGRRRALFWDPWWWWGPPYFPYYPYYPPPPRADDVLLQALPVGTIQAGARTEGFVYFPRLRAEARRLSFEFHYRLGEASRVFTLPFGVERADREGRPGRVVAAAL